MITLAGLFGLGSTEMIVIFGLAVLLFGAARLPQLARSMGKSINEFKRGMADPGKEGETAAEPGKQDGAAEKKD